MVIPATTQAGVVPKCSVLFPDAVVLFVDVGLVSVAVALLDAVIV